MDFSKALVIGPHPDDAEILVGGTMIKWASEGTEVILCVVTNGALGSNDPSVKREDLIRTREAEQLEAASLMGVSEVVFLRHEDGYVEDSHELRRDLIREIRRHKPEVVVGVDPSMYYFQQWYINHPDHRRTGEAFLAAVNPGATTLPLYRAELYDQGFEPHGVQCCLLAGPPKADFFIDISDYMDLKIKALAAHRSQMDEWKEMEDTVRSMSQWMAAESGEQFRYAEGFKAILFPSAEPPAERAADQNSDVRSIGHSQVGGI